MQEKKKKKKKRNLETKANVCFKNERTLHLSISYVMNPFK